MTDTQSTQAVKDQQLYRLYDADGTLLYIGISYSAIARYAQHKATQPWIGDVCRIEIETHDVSRAEILEIERRAIADEQPKHNKIGRTSRPEYVAENAFDHTWLRQFAGQQYDAVISGVQAAMFAFGSLKSPGDQPNDIRKFWLEALEAHRYPDMHHECRAESSAVHVPFLRRPDGWCLYRCTNCGGVWKCWWA